MSQRPPTRHRGCRCRSSGGGSAWFAGLESPHSDAGPDQLHNAERPRARQESVDAGQNTATREGKHEPAGSSLKCVHDHHERDRADAVDRDCHPLSQAVQRSVSVTGGRAGVTGRGASAQVPGPVVRALRGRRASHRCPLCVVRRALRVGRRPVPRRSRPAAARRASLLVCNFVVGAEGAADHADTLLVRASARGGQTASRPLEQERRPTALSVSRSWCGSWCMRKVVEATALGGAWLMPKGSRMGRSAGGGASPSAPLWREGGDGLLRVRGEQVKIHAIGIVRERQETEPLPPCSGPCMECARHDRLARGFLVDGHS